MAITTTLQLTPEPPYDFAATAGFAARFNDRSGADHFSGGVYTRAVELRFQPLIFSIHSVGTDEYPALTLDLEHRGNSLDEEVVFAAQVTAGRMMGIRQKLDGFYRMAREDWTLSELVRDFTGLHIPQTSSVFEALVQMQVGKGLPRQASERAREMMVERLGQTVEGHGITLNAFPTERALLDGAANLENLPGLPEGRADSIAAIAEASLAGVLDRESFEAMSDSEASSLLSQLPGVDQWVVDWTLILGLGRPDVVPSDEPAMRRAVALMTGDRRLAAPGRVVEFAQRWKPWRSFATAYVIAALRNGRDYWS